LIGGVLIQMFRGYRLLLAVWWTLAFAAPGNGKEPQTAQPNGDQRIIHQLERIAATLDKVSQERPADAGCRAGKDNRQSDLCAQWKAADAAAESAWSAYAAFWAAIVGLLIGALTLIAAGFAAKFARDAAIHTEAGANEAKRAADAAEQSLESSREVAQSDLRAWLDIDLTLVGCGRNDRFASITVNVELKNLGKTPALRTAVSVKAYVKSALEENYGTWPSTNETARPITSILPGKTADGNVQARIDAEEIAAGVAKAKSEGFEPVIIVDAVVHYHTIFDTEDSPKRLTSTRYVMLSTVQMSPEYRSARMEWLDRSGPAEPAQVKFARHKGAPVHLT
jgi:hypothetical protein